jgi:DNA repair protein RecN (Recombination protein N)
LARGAQLAEALLYGEDGSAFDKLGKASAEIEPLARLDADLSPVLDSLTSARREVQEAARTLERYASRIEADPARLAEVEERLSELRRLARKHGGAVDELARRVEELRRELASLDNTDDRVDGLKKRIDEVASELLAKAQQLGRLRHAAAGQLDAAVLAQVADMDLGGAVFQTQVKTQEPRQGSIVVDGQALGPAGIDEVEFLWSANRGEPPRPLAKIASGGELSRLMLAVKTVLHHRDLVSLYVFDEVDTGLGGRAADSIGRKIQQVARDHQAITITHWAPIAARADSHLRVRKKAHGNRTVSYLEAISGAERAEEIARMIDGARVTETTREAARQMLARK